MRIFRRIISFVAVLCLLCALLPSAYADEAGDALFKDKTWDEVIADFFARYSINPDLLTLGYCNTVSGEEYYHNGDKYMLTGSMYKLPLNMYYTEMIHDGEMDWDSPVYDVPYSILMEGSIIDSNNDYAEILWRSLGSGSYQTYRELIAPYMGEKADAVDAKFYENNFFTARQMISCLKLLCTESERFPKMIETMQRAEPENYFKQNERRFEIAHKYGYLGEDYPEYLNDCAIAYTDEPIVFVMFTHNVPNAYEIMGAYCTLMCDYAQYNTPIRLEAERLAAEAQNDPAPAAQSPSPNPAAGSLAEPKEDTDISFSTILTAALILVAVVAGIAGLIVCSRRNKIKVLWAILSVLLAEAAMLACLVASEKGTIIAKAEGDPQETVTEFFDALIAADYQAAYSYLRGYSSLGLENSPTAETGVMIYDALRASYSYELSGPCQVDKLRATQTVSFTYLDLPSIEADVEKKTMEVISQFVETRTRKQLYDDNDKYLPEVTAEAYSTALSAVLAQAENYYVTVSLPVELEYSGENWLIIPAQSLLKAIVGGAAY